MQTGLRGTGLKGSDCLEHLLLLLLLPVPVLNLCHAVKRYAFFKVHRRVSLTGGSQGREALPGVLGVNQHSGGYGSCPTPVSPLPCFFFVFTVFCCELIIEVILLFIANWKRTFFRCCLVAFLTKSISSVFLRACFATAAASSDGGDFGICGRTHTGFLKTDLFVFTKIHGCVRGGGLERALEGWKTMHLPRAWGGGGGSAVCYRLASLGTLYTLSASNRPAVSPGPGLTVVPPLTVSPPPLPSLTPPALDSVT